MGRKRTDAVRESLQELRRVEELQRDTPQAERVRMLILMREDPARSLGTIAREIGRSDPTVERWWKLYRDEGLEGLLREGKRGGGKESQLASVIVDELRHEVMQGRLGSAKEIRTWLNERWGVNNSRSGVQSLVRTRIKESGLTREPERVRAAPVQPAQPAVSLPQVRMERIVSFLNRIPITDSTINWIGAINEGLQSLLEDVDRVSMSVNITCDLEDPGAYRPNLLVNQHPTVQDCERISVDVIDEDARPSTIMLADFRRQGLPVHEYHPPASYDFYLNGKAYVGSMILWRKREKTPISDETLELITALEPFLIFVFSSHIALHQQQKPINRVFHDALAKLVADAGLTDQERRIVVLQLLGNSYKSIADILSITVAGVKKHLSTIHRKTNTRSFTELFAKYFTPGQPD